MARKDEPSYADLVYEVLRSVGRPLTFQEIFDEVARRRPIATRDPKATIRNALSQGKQLISLGDGSYSLASPDAGERPLAGAREPKGEGGDGGKPVPATAHLIERSVGPKHALSEFARGPRFRCALGQALKERFGEGVVADPGRIADFHDRFTLQHRLPDGRTLVEHFLKSHPGLPEEDRAMLLAWHDVVEGIFQVKGRDGEALLAFNLIDELTYRMRSNLGPRVFDQMPTGSYIAVRVVPVGDEWLMSGVTGVMFAARREEAYRFAERAALADPGLALRNPLKLERAWEIQREDRRQFVAFFGSDEVVVPGHQVAERMRAFHRFRTHEVRDAQGKSMVDRSMEAYGFVPKEAEPELPDRLLKAETVGIIYDEVEGLHFLAGYGTVKETFANPELAGDRRHREAVLGYLEEPSIPPLALRRLAERDSGRASRVFRRVLNQQGFSWDRDGETLLRHHKASYFDRPPRPGIRPLSAILAQAALAPQGAAKAKPGMRRPGGKAAR